MKDKRPGQKPTDNLFYSPSKTQLVALLAVWFTGGFLLLAAMTDLFTRSPFQGSYLLLYFLLLSSTAVVGKTVFRYVSLRYKRANR